MHVACCRLIKSGGNHLCFHRALHFGHFLRPLIDQQNHHVACGVVGCNSVSNVLHHHCFAALGRGDKQRSLAFANGRNDVDDAAGDIFFTFDVLLELHMLTRKQRGQIFKHHLVFVVLW